MNKTEILESLVEGFANSIEELNITEELSITNGDVLRVLFKVLFPQVNFAPYYTCCRADISTSYGRYSIDIDYNWWNELFKCAGTTVCEVTKTKITEALEMAIKALGQEQEPCNDARVGKWLLRDENYPDDVPTICSKCGHSFTDYICGYEWKETGDLPNFCPNCGIKMIKPKPQESEDKEKDKEI